ncbi:hypothetical protein LINPERHAP1_LOCUS9453 [Linum perenne]
MKVVCGVLSQSRMSCHYNITWLRRQIHGGT